MTKRNPVDTKKVIELYLAGHTMEKIAEEVGTNANAINNHIVYLRKKGVNLPRRVRGVDVADLNKFISERTGDEPEEADLPEEA